MFLDRFLNHLISSGDLTVIGPDGRRRHYGNGQVPGIDKSVIRIKSLFTVLRLALNPSLALGEAYMDGSLEIEEGGLYNFLALCLDNARQAGLKGRLGWPDRIDYFFRSRLMNNPMPKAYKNVAHHYNLSGDFYKLFLDEDWQYSCAYFEDPHASLEEAQRAKKRHIAAKLLLAPDKHVLDIGCGWGGMAIYLAQHYGVRVTGITLSKEQLKVARERAEKTGLADRVSFELRDYRTVKGQFDRIVSIGMFEHVGVSYYQDYFDQIHKLLTDDGVALVHSIGRSDGPGTTNHWIRKYIFPGGYMPPLSEVMPYVESANIYVSDIEFLWLHYAMTLAEWRRRFMARSEDVKKMYSETFCRMWEFFLASSEASFRQDNLMVFQMQLTKSRGAVPLTRDYLYPRDMGEHRVQARVSRGRGG